MASPTSPLLPSAVQPSYNAIPASSTNGAGAPPSAPERSLEIPNLLVTSLPGLLEHFNVSSHPSASDTALVLVALLSKLKRTRELEENVKGKSTRDTWEAKERTRELSARVEALLGDAWELWLKDGEGEAERVLWESVAPAPYSRVIDFLPLMSVPASFGSHELIQLSFHTTWGSGLQPFFAAAEPAALFSAVRFLTWLDSFSTPRLLHLHALCLRIAHLLLAIWISLYPSPTAHWGVPSILWTLFTLCTSLELPWHPSLFRLLSLLTLVTALPTPPQPSHLSFLLLLSSIAVSLISFHLPLHPSPILLFVNKQVIATSTRFEYLLSRALIPSILYFLPLVLASIFALALALNGDPWHPYLLLRATFEYAAEVAPYETRIACLVAVILALAGYIWLIEFATVELAARGEQRENEDAQRGFVRAMIDYSYLPGREERTGYRLPAPLNLAELAVADLPYYVLCALRGRARASKWRVAAKAVVWRTCVAPVTAVLSLAYAWEWPVAQVWRRAA